MKRKKEHINKQMRMYKKLCNFIESCTVIWRDVKSIFKFVQLLTYLCLVTLVITFFMVALIVFQMFYCTDTLVGIML